MALPQWEKKEPEAAGISGSQGGVWVGNEGRRATVWSGKLSDCFVRFCAQSCGCEFDSDATV